ncbi:MAG: transcriptional regulator, partial [Pedobacter sp.]
MRRVFLLFLIVLYPFISLNAQGPIGLPQVSSYSSLQYKGGTQNWGITQDKNGILYFANNEGLLTFNGAYWKSYLLPNKTIVRSVKIDVDGKTYVGGQDEIGYFFPNANGSLVYHSLKKLIPQGEKQFADIWDIQIIGKDVFFRTVNKIFKLTGNKIEVYITRNAWVYLGIARNEILAHENKVGLKYYKNGQWQIKCDDKRIINATITSILPYSGDTLLITTLKNGLFLLKGNELIKKQTVNDNVFHNDRINCAIQINHDLYAIGTTSSALLIVNKAGAIQRQFSYAEGLNNNNIRSILLDKHQNLWLGLDDGISFIAFNSAIKHIYPDRNKQVSSYATRIFNKKLYIGTSNGLLVAPINLDQDDLSNTQANFTEVSNTKGQTWGLAEINKHLLLANEEGSYVVNDYSATQLFGGLGTWVYSSLSKNKQDDNVVAGTYTGLQLLHYKDGIFSNEGTLSALNEPLRFIAVDQKLNCVWASHPYRGIYKLDLSPDRKKIIKTTLLGEKDGLPLTLYNYIFTIKGKIVAATADGIYEYDHAKKRFYQSSYFRPMFKNLSVQFLNEDMDGNVWFVSEKKVGV